MSVEKLQFKIPDSIYAISWQCDKCDSIRHKQVSIEDVQVGVLAIFCQGANCLNRVYFEIQQKIVEPRIRIASGIKIMCPGCGDHICETIKSIAHGEVISTNLVKWLNQEYQAGEAMECKKCDRVWCNGTDIFTEIGWL